MKKISIISFLLLFVFSVQAQNYFNKLYPQGFDFENILVTESHYYAVGDLYHGSNVRSNFIAKLDHLGNLLTVDTITPITNSSAQGFLLKSQSGFVFSCIINSTANFSADSSDILFRRYDESFSILSETIIGGHKKDEIQQIKQTPDGGYIITGKTCSFGDSLYNDYYLVKVDSLGEVEWDKNYGLVGISDVSNSVAVCSDGGYIMCGSTWILPTPDVNGNYQTMVIKVDSLGNQVWLKTFGTDENDAGGGVVELNDRSYLISTGFGGQQVQIFPVLLKLDYEGNVIWEKHYQDSEYSNFSAVIVVNPDETFVIKGITKNSQSISVGWLNKFDPNGNIIWQREYEIRADIPQYIYDVKPALDGGYLFCGTAFDTNTVQNSWLVKTDCFGCDSLLCYYPDSICSGYDCSLYPISADFTIDDAIINLANAGEDTVTFVNPFGNTTNRVWDFGDGNVSYTDSVVQHAYSQIGTYEVQLIVYHGMCSDTLTQTVEVVNVSGLPSSLEGGSRRVTIAPNPNNGSFTIDSPFLYDTPLTLFNTQGKAVYQTQLKKGKNELNLNLSPGVYVLESGSHRERIVVQ